MRIKNSNIIKAIGPGILFAGAAIGGSHLIQSTRAGANYGFDLLLLVLLVNIFKYPFFEYGHRYVAATGESLLHGYAKLGRWAVVTFFVLNIVTAIVNGAAVTVVTAGLTSNLFGIQLPQVWISVFLLIVTLAILFAGHYGLLDSVIKIMVSILALSTITTVLFAWFYNPASTTPTIVTTVPDIWSSAGIAFLLALMGWMPAPIECSVWPSLWTIERSKQTSYKPNLREVLVDFHIGYIGTTLMALMFLSLGALVMYGSGESFSNSGVVFSSQLVSLYTKTIGDWSKYIIGTIVFITMVSTTLTVFDAYPRTFAGLSKMIFKNIGMKSNSLYLVCSTAMAVAAALIIGLFTSGMKSLLDFAAVISFLAAPVFAIINYKVVTSSNMPDAFKPSKGLKILSWIGILFFICFGLLFLVSKIV